MAVSIYARLWYPKMNRAINKVFVSAPRLADGHKDMLLYSHLTRFRSPSKAVVIWELYKKNTIVLWIWSKINVRFISEMCLTGHHLIYISQWLAWSLNIHFYILVKKKQIPPLTILSKYCISIIKPSFTV